jgi:PBP1b-binding outer membrane lipoprotein LpoB
MLRAGTRFRAMKKYPIMLGLAVVLAGCASHSSEPNSLTAKTAPTAAAAEEPRTVTDLSQISATEAAPPAMPQIAPGDSSRAESDQNSNATVQQNIERLFVSRVDQLRYDEGHAEAPTETSLLNDKARKFSDFSYQLLNQTLTAAHNIEPDRLAGRKLPVDIAPMVLTAVMDSQGRLTEISIESHSGDHQVDQIIIDSCKQGLWSRNPPSAAIDNDGLYRVRVRGYIRAYTVNFQGIYKYETDLALGIL